MIRFIKLLTYLSEEIGRGVFDVIDVVSDSHSYHEASHAITRLFSKTALFRSLGMLIIFIQLQLMCIVSVPYKNDAFDSLIV